MKISSITRRRMIVQSAAGALAFAGCRRFSAGARGSGGNGHLKIGLLYFAPEEGADLCMRGLFDGLKEQGLEK
jgi:hypothetical protein